MSCFNGCCETTASKDNEINLDHKDKYKEAYTKLYLSLKKVIQNFKHLQSKKQITDVEEITKFIKTIVEQYDQQMTDIETMKKTINDITDYVENDEILKNISLDLKKNEKNDTLNNVVHNITEGLKGVIKQLQESKCREEKLLDENKLIKNNTNEAIKTIEDCNTYINELERQNSILALSNIVGCSAPSSVTNINKNNGCQIKTDIRGNKIPVYFLSKDGKTKLSGDTLTNNYQKDNFENIQFYYPEGEKYKKLDNLKNIKNLDTKKIILAAKKKI